MQIEPRVESRWLAVWVLFAGVFLAGCSVRQMIYPIPSVPVGSPPRPLTEVVLRVADGTEVVAWHRSDVGLGADRPAMVFFHGNGENLETMKWADLYADLMGLNVPFLAVDYPGYGRSTGEPSEQSLKAAAEGALDWLAQRYGDRSLVPCGWSLGAALAIHLAAVRDQQVDGLIAMSPWTSMADVAKNHFPAWLVGLALSERYDSLALASRIRQPALIVHGGSDRIIPVTQGETLAAALDRATWLRLESAGHNDLLGLPQVWQQIAAFLSDLKPRRAV